MISDYPWGRFYETAILETDRSQLAKHIQMAEEALSARVRELNGNRDGTEQERSAIHDALSGLRILRDELKQGVPEGAFEFGSEEDVARNNNSGRCNQEHD
jgi:predicted  nucleic acid-binding Zn-ribbon protein